MRRTYIHTEKDGSWYIVISVFDHKILDDSHRGGRIICDDQLLFLDEMIDVTEGKLTLLSGSKTNGLVYYQSTTPFGYKPFNTSPTSYPLFGSGILGTNVHVDGSYSVRLKQPIVLETEMHEEVFRNVARKTLIYMETGTNTEAVVNGWSIVGHFGRNPIFDKNSDEQILFNFHRGMLETIRNKWYSKLSGMRESPVTLICKYMGYDGIIASSMCIVFVK